MAISKPTKKPVATAKGPKPKTAALKGKRQSVKKPDESRQRKAPKYKHFRLQPRIKHEKGRPASFMLLINKTFSLFKSTWKPILILSLVFLIFQMAVVRGFQAPININEFKTSVNDLFGGELGGGETAFAALGALFGAQSNAVGPDTGLYNAILIVLFSLMFIWIYRQKSAGNKFKIKEAVYKSPYPLNVVLGVLVVIALQTLPFVLGSLLFSIVMQGGIAVNSYEKFVWWLFLGGTALLSLYMISSSIFALYIASLPDMSPMLALRSARNLVKHRRFSVMSRILLYIIFVVLIGSGLMLPLIFFAGSIAGWVFLILTTLLLPLTHAFMYTLYRELL